MRYSDFLLVLYPIPIFILSQVIISTRFKSVLSNHFKTPWHRLNLSDHIKRCPLGFSTRSISEIKWTIISSSICGRSHLAFPLHFPSFPYFSLSKTPRYCGSKNTTETTSFFYVAKKPYPILFIFTVQVTFCFAFKIAHFGYKSSPIIRFMIIFAISSELLYGLLFSCSSRALLILAQNPSYTFPHFNNSSRNIFIACLTSFIADHLLHDENILYVSIFFVICKICIKSLWISRLKFFHIKLHDLIQIKST